MEHQSGGNRRLAYLVAPHAGAWIGTTIQTTDIWVLKVAPHAGAWIGTTGSRPSWTLWRYRVGDYRIITVVEDTNVRVLIVKVGHRREVYDR